MHCSDHDSRRKDRGPCNPFPGPCDSGRGIRRKGHGMCGDDLDVHRWNSEVRRKGHGLRRSDLRLCDRNKRMRLRVHGTYDVPAVPCEADRSPCDVEPELCDASHRRGAERQGLNDPAPPCGWPCRRRRRRPGGGRRPRPRRFRWRTCRGWRASASTPAPRSGRRG